MAAKVFGYSIVNNPTFNLNLSQCPCVVYPNQMKVYTVSIHTFRKCTARTADDLNQQCEKLDFNETINLKGKRVVKLLPLIKDPRERIRGLTFL